MRYSCLHTHTFFCDGSDDVETYCRRAWEKGFHSLGFSAHGPVTRKTGIRTSWNMEEERLPEYLDAVREARRRWEGKLRIYLGLEADFIPGLTGPADREYRELGLDYLIGSVHFIIPPKGPPLEIDGRWEPIERGIREGFGGDGEALTQAYWDNVAAMIAAGGFDILGHMDLIKKNNQAPGSPPPNRIFNPKGPEYLRRGGEIARAAAKTGIVVEVNTGGINRGSIAEPYPSPAFLKIFRENSVPALIAADAHRAEDLDGHYDTAQKALLAAGYTGTVLFEGKEGEARWIREPLPGKI
ncbi:MAG: histidinol-phosphatase [Treponema sp.]|nr:histidinol-phosphatase [Treponema sp.]